MDNETMEDRAGRLANRASAGAEAVAGAARERAADIADKAGPAAEFVYGQARDQLREVGAGLGDAVEKQPLAALVAVGLVGGALGFLLGRR